MSKLYLNIYSTFVFTNFLYFFKIRMETFEYKSLSTMAKTIGTLVAIIGAFVATLYKGPQVFGINPLNTILTTPSAWAIGGLLTMICSIIASLFIISQVITIVNKLLSLCLILRDTVRISIFKRLNFVR